MKNIPQTMPRQVNIMLLGKTGHGKSSTGNSLLGWDAFDDDDCAQSATSRVSAARATHGGVDVMVVDTPGMRDTRTFDPARETANAVRYMEAGVDACTDGVDLFLLVLPYGRRFTEEEVGAVRDITRTSYGREVTERCSVLFTFGDDFRLRHRGGDFRWAFRRWCREQGGALGELLDSVEQRHFLVDNLRFSHDEMEGFRDDVIQQALYNRRVKGPFTRSFLQSLLSKIKSLAKKVLDGLSGCSLM